ncbi:MAG TPA: hypothetical protein VJ997_04675, partial [Longimicrobiales bacterium]|nr:hypothetical protein [Longimicrobiales bacterium]
MCRMRRTPRTRLLRLFLSSALVVPAGPFLSAQQPPTPGPRVSQPDSLRWEYMGPPSSGRFAAIAGVPGDPSTYYLGSASGGVWKTTDEGKTFAPLFDDQPVQAIGALAVAPSDTDVVWAGTGEAWAIRDADIMGDG